MGDGDNASRAAVNFVHAAHCAHPFTFATTPMFAVAVALTSGTKNIRATCYVHASCAPQTHSARSVCLLNRTRAVWRTRTYDNKKHALVHTAHTNTHESRKSYLTPPLTTGNSRLSCCSAGHCDARASSLYALSADPSQTIESASD